MVLLVVVDQLLQHTVQHRRNCEEPLHSCTDVAESLLITEDLLDDEGSHCFGKSLSVLHDPETKRDDLSLHEEGDGVGITLLDESSDDSQRSDP